MRFFVLAMLMSTLVSGCQASDPSYEIVGDTIPTPLTTEAGNFDRGHRVFTDRDAGHCVLCHQVEGLDAEFQGNVGPALSRVGSYLSPEQLRLRIVDYDVVRSGTVMPSYYRSHNLHQVGGAYAGRTVLSAQDIEDLIAYLVTLDGN